MGSKEGCGETTNGDAGACARAGRVRGRRAAFPNIPPEVRERGLLHILDGLGLGLASTRHAFATSALAGIAALSAGDDRCTMIGQTLRAAPRDAALVQRHPDPRARLRRHASAGHRPSDGGLSARGTGRRRGARDVGRGASSSPIASAWRRRSGSARPSRAGSTIPAFTPRASWPISPAALAAGRLLGLEPDALVAAQGIAASTASGGPGLSRGRRLDETVPSRLGGRRRHHGRRPSRNMGSAARRAPTRAGSACSIPIFRATGMSWRRPS